MKNNMKKIFIALVLAMSIASCTNPNLVIGDEYIVVSVQKSISDVYCTQYYVTAKSVNEWANAYTFNGNVMKYYTNTLYSVGDTIKISNKNGAIRKVEKELDD